MADIKVNKNAVELRSELQADGTKVEYIVIDGQKIGVMGSVSEADRAAAIKALNAAYVASNGNIYEMMYKLGTIATIEEKEIEPDEVVEVCGVEVILSYSKAKAYTMDGYHEDLELLELAEVTIDTTRKEEPKQWRYAGNKYLLRKDKVVLDENGKATDGPYNLSRYHVSYRFKDFLGFFYRIGYWTNIQEFKKFLGSDTYTVGSGRVVTVNSVWHIQEWYKTKQRVRGEGKQQKLTNKLTEMQLSDTSDFVVKYPVTKDQDFYGYNQEVRGIIYFERLSDGWSVLRVF